MDGSDLLFHFVGLAMALSFAIFPDTFSTKGLLSIDLIDGSPVWSAVVTCLLNLVVAPVINLPMFLGEELGWRGFLNPLMEKMLGYKGTLAAGAIWGLWHIPMIVVHGLNYPDHPWSGILLFVVFCVLFNIVWSRLYERSRNIFVLAHAHGTLNWTAITLFSLADQESINDLLFGPTGLAGILVLLVAVGGLSCSGIKRFATKTNPHSF